MTPAQLLARAIFFYGASAVVPQAAPRNAAMLRAGRNDACPCGSGKKFKHCHHPHAQALTRQAAREAEVAAAERLEASP
jgi:hypothetical protein